MDIDHFHLYFSALSGFIFTLLMTRYFVFTTLFLTSDTIKTFDHSLFKHVLTNISPFECAVLPFLKDDVHYSVSF